MNIKSCVKKVIKMTRGKQLIPIQQMTDSDKILENKVAVIIGGSGGIGLAIAKSFAESGCNVILCGTNERKLEKSLEHFSDLRKVGTMVFNIADISSMKNNVEKAVEKFGKVDILVCSAGVHTDNVNYFTMRPEEYERVMDVNLKGPYFLCKEFAEYMSNCSDGGAKKHILLVSSSRGSEPAWSPYGISKWGLNGMTKGLAQILLPYGIVVNAIAPGTTATELIGFKTGESINADDNGIGRLIMPSEVANIARMLVSPAGDMLVGETIHVSGGRGVFDIR